MAAITEVHYAGELAAVVTAGHAILEPALEGRQLEDVQAMCLYAITLSDEQPGRVYADADALAYAEHVRATRVVTRGLEP